MKISSIRHGNTEMILNGPFSEGWEEIGGIECLCAKLSKGGHWILKMHYRYILQRNLSRWKKLSFNVLSDSSSLIETDMDQNIMVFDLFCCEKTL